MTLGPVYLIGIVLFGLALIALIALRDSCTRVLSVSPLGTIIASTTAGTTLTDFATRSIGIGYTGGSALLLALVILSFAAWKAMLGTVSVDSEHEAAGKIVFIG